MAKTRWTTVKVPVELRNRIREEATKRNMSQWELIATAISMLSETKQYKNLDQLDKIAYYIMKLSYSISLFKKEPSEENYTWALKTVDQISTRLELDLGDLRKAIENYYRKKNKESLITLNMLWKDAIKRLILKLA